jgi:hypothetical protein
MFIAQTLLFWITILGLGGYRQPYIKMQRWTGLEKLMHFETTNNVVYRVERIKKQLIFRGFRIAAS